MEKLLFVLLISVVVARPNRPGKPKCCFPERMSGKEGASIGTVINGNGSAMTGLYDFAYDFKLKKVAAKGHLYVNGVDKDHHILYDYGNKKKYEKISGKNCTIDDFKVPLLTCVPADAYPYISTYYGVGSQKFDITGYVFNFGSSRISMTVTKEECAILSEHIEMENFVLDVGFMGVSFEKVDESFFDIPEDCKRSTNCDNQTTPPTMLP